MQKVNRQKLVNLELIYFAMALLTFPDETVKPVIIPDKNPEVKEIKGDR